MKVKSETTWVYPMQHVEEPENCQNCNLHTSKITTGLPHNSHWTNHISKPRAKFGERRYCRLTINPFTYIQTYWWIKVNKVDIKDPATPKMWRYTTMWNTWNLSINSSPSTAPVLCPCYTGSLAAHVTETRKLFTYMNKKLAVDKNKCEDMQRMAKYS